MARIGYGLAAQRPAALVDLPRFNGDQLIERRSGGDLSIQACADDPQVAFHAVRQLAAMAYGAAEIRWVQTGFSAGSGSGGTPRNLMGFKDGTRNPATHDLAAAVWVGSEGPAWMQGGSYLVARRIRIALEHWDRSEIDYQEQVVGRHKISGAPLGGHRELDTPDFDAADKEGNPVIPEDAHIRLGAHENNGGALILRRAYSYNDGANVIAERWPPWRQGMSYDAGLFFLAYQRDPRTGFIRIFERMAQARCDEPVHHPCRQRPVRHPAGRHTGIVHWPALVPDSLIEPSGGGHRRRLRSTGWFGRPCDGERHCRNVC